MLRIANHYISKSISCLLLAEFCILLLLAYAAAAFRFDAAYLLTSKAHAFTFSAVIFAIVMNFSMSLFGMYQDCVREGVRATFLRLMPASVLAFVTLTMLFYVIPSLYFGRGVLGLIFLFSTPAILLTRTMYFASSKSQYLSSRLLFLGAGPMAHECSRLALQRGFAFKYSIVGYVPLSEEQSQIDSSELIKLVNNSLVETALYHRVDEIIVSVENRRGAFPIKHLLECKLRGIKVIDAADFFEREACQLRVASLQPSWLVFNSGFDQGQVRMIGKRAFDIVMSAVLGLVALPVMAVTALLIVLEDGGPVLYQQERVGKGGKCFNVLKFRSMGKNAERAGVPQWATTNDPRTTRIGRIIRKCRIDELPQIINVFKGHMSFVGPRPERPFFVDQLNQQIPYYNIRHSIKPGITGMAQVRYAYGASVEDAIEKLQYDLYYVKNNSLFLDAIILMETIQVVLFGKGAR